MSVRIITGDSLTVLRTMESESVQCVVTSPPYLGLRTYGTDPQTWGGDPSHSHEWSTVPSPGSRTSDTNPGPLQHAGNKGRERLASNLCACGAWRGELGLEPTPALFIEHLVAIFEEVRRVLRADGTCWVNLGDSYWTRSAMRKGGNREQIKAMAGEIEMDSWAEHAAEGRTRYSSGHPTLKDKDLSLIPERFAIAMQDAGWWVRSRIAWCKTSAMPESVSDRPTSAWEHIWLFSKSARYFYDAEAVRQPLATALHAPGNKTRVGPQGGGRTDAGYFERMGATWGSEAGANLRNYWLLGPEPSTLEHYAAYPTELVKRCILAGTSQRGACPACRAPWVRTTERVDQGWNGARYGERAVAASGGAISGGTARSTLGSSNGRLTGKSETTGWSPSCTCDAGEPVAQTVLDIFAGSGTTGLVADRLQRDAILIELSEKYCDMARRRLQRDAGPMFADSIVVAS
jgi:DNA modification methylase